jgi:hypothetical protein
LRKLHGAFLGVDERTRLLLDVHTLGLRRLHTTASRGSWTSVL